MIVGLVMFIVAGLVLYISKTTIKKSSQQAAKKTQDTATKTEPINDLVNQCLDKLAKDAVTLIGKQGGYIYKNQGGTLVSFSDSDEGEFYIEDGSFKVAYNIIKSSLHLPQPYSFIVPDYPWKNFPAKPNMPCNTKNSDTEFHGIFGFSVMPPLNSSEGPHSIQTQIETFIENNLGTCLDFKLFKDEGYEITMSKNKTKVIIGTDDISLRSEIPLKVMNTFTKETLEMRDFSTNLNIRFKDFYYFVKQFINNDIGDVTFNMKDPKNYKNLFSVRIADNAYHYDDLITVRDEKSLINGKPLEYTFARENRYPAIYCIENPVLEFPEGEQITQEKLLQGSELKAEDPDEDTIKFSVKALLPNPDLPVNLDQPFIQFKVSASDGDLEDFEIITVNRKG